MVVNSRFDESCYYKIFSNQFNVKAMALVDTLRWFREDLEASN